MKRSYRVVKVNQGDAEYFLVQKRYWLLFWKTSKHFNDYEEEDFCEHDLAFRDLEEAMAYLYRLKAVDNRSRKIVYSECNFL